MLTLRNRQRARALNLRFFRHVMSGVLGELLPHSSLELGIYFVGRPEITRLNEQFLRHKGPTDVISFDYSEGAGGDIISGEVFICVEEAISQARRFRTMWQSELVRYAIHGVLHLCGHDDRAVAARQRMKREENRLLAEAARRFCLQHLDGKK